MADWKHRVRAAINRLGVDVVPLSRSPAAALRGLRRFPIRTVIDVGANEGQFARRARRLFPGARLFCFEPLPGPFERLDRWARSEAKDVTAIPRALGDREASVPMRLHVAHDPSSSMLRTTALATELFEPLREQKTLIVSQATLDAEVAAGKVTLAPDVLVKMDVQGYEDRVIRGGRATFAKARAVLLEVGLVSLYEGQASFADLVARLADAGLRFGGTIDQVHDGDGRALYMDAIFVRD